MIYNKLVRDKIPSIIDKSGKTATYRQLYGEEYEKALKDKLIEETQELVNAATKEQLIEELADVLEVIDTIRLFNNIAMKEVNDMLISKAHTKGSFIGGTYLEEVKDED